jgi:DNA modification methylase
MTVKQMSIGKIKLNSRNARTHSAKQIQQIANSINIFGFTNPLLISEDGELIAGHGRYEAAELLGLSEVPVIVVYGLSPAKRRALAIADNKIAENAGWDRERLAIEIPELAHLLTTEGLNVSILGFEAVEIEQIQTDLEGHAADPWDKIDPNWCDAIPVSKRGDLWLLGNHKLLCGDAGSAGDVALLMSDCRADLGFIDSPSLPTNQKPSRTFTSRLTDVLNAAAAVSCDGATHFICMDWRHLAECMAAGKLVYGEALDLIVWVKSHAAEGPLYGNQHEVFGMFRTGKSPRRGLELGRHRRMRSNVWRYSERKSIPAGKLNSQPKPVALIADAIEDWTQRGDVVLDILSGWGSAIVAAERVGRHARALETDPWLVDLAIRRWQKFTRSDARHAENGRSFDQIVADRIHADHGLAPNKGSGRGQ